MTVELAAFFTLVFCLSYSSPLKMAMIGFSEASLELTELHGGISHKMEFWQLINPLRTRHSKNIWERQLQLNITFMKISGSDYILVITASVHFRILHVPVPCPNI
jgi:hypothetical protein